jgi:hypothetical protein
MLKINHINVKEGFAISIPVFEFQHRLQRQQHGWTATISTAI